MSKPIVWLATLSLRAEYINIIASDIFLLIRVPDSIVALVTKENFITITVLLPPLSSRKIYQPLVKSSLHVLPGPVLGVWANALYVLKINAVDGSAFLFACFKACECLLSSRLSQLQIQETGLWLAKKAFSSCVNYAPKSTLHLSESSPFVSTSLTRTSCERWYNSVSSSSVMQLLLGSVN